MRRGQLAEALRRSEPAVLVVLPVAMLALTWLDIPGIAVVTSALAGIALVPFFAGFELERLSARDLMPIVVMTALAVAGRLIFAPVPAVKPVTAIVIIAGICFGKEEGFITGALTMLVSNIFFGQGLWTPWQMYGMGLVGYLSGVFGNGSLMKSRWTVAAFGFAMVFLYGVILDTWTLVGFVEDRTLASVMATYTVGFFTNLASAVGTVLFLVPIAATWPKMFSRIKAKYTIGSRPGKAS